MQKIIVASSLFVVFLSSSLSASAASFSLNAYLKSGPLGAQETLNQADTQIISLNQNVDNVSLEVRDVQGGSFVIIHSNHQQTSASVFVSDEFMKTCDNSPTLSLKQNIQLKGQPEALDTHTGQVVKLPSGTYQVEELWVSCNK